MNGDDAGAGPQSNAAVVSGPSTGRKVKTKDRNPRTPQVLTFAKLLVPIAAFGLLVSAFGGTQIYGEISAGRRDPSEVWGFAIIPLLFLLVLLFALFYRVHIGHESIKHSFLGMEFSPVRYFEVDDLDRFRRDVTIRSGKKKASFNRYWAAYSLVYLRMLEELHYRRFTLFGIRPDDQRWEAVAAQVRQEFATLLYTRHKGFYEAHPEEYQHLWELTQTPVSYRNG